MLVCHAVLKENRDGQAITWVCSITGYEKGSFNGTVNNLMKVAVLCLFGNSRVLKDH